MKGKFLVMNGQAFLRADGTWTDDPATAQTFGTFDAALAAASAVLKVKTTDYVNYSRHVFGPVQ